MELMELKERDQVEVEHTWDLTSLYNTEAEWISDIDSIKTDLLKFSDNKASFLEKNENIKQTLDLYFSCMERIEKVYTYAHLLSDQDLTSSTNQEKLDRAMILYSEYSSISSFIAPTLLQLSISELTTLSLDAQFLPYKKFIEDLIKEKPHIRSISEEHLLSLAGESLGASSKVFSQLTNADLKFKPVSVNENGQVVEKPLSHGTFITFLESQDREVRKDAFQKYYDSYNDHKHSISTSLIYSCKKDYFLAKARNFSSSREKSLFSDRIPIKVYDTLVDSVRKNISVLNDYYTLRKKHLKLDKQYLYDTYVPLVSGSKMSFKYEEAVSIIKESLSPLGASYTETLTKGLSTDRWVDKYENKGKRSGAYSSGCYGSAPYILMNYKDESINSLYTLAHEAGHSMHTYLANKTQNFANHSYTIFVAEVASTFNEILVSRYLENKYSDNKEYLNNLINHQVDDIKSTFFRQTMFAEFEREIHGIVDTDQPVTLDIIREKYSSLLNAYFGPSLTFNELDNLECLRIPHFYSSFYVFKYATGLSAAHKLVDIVLEEGPERYLKFLSSGGSRDSLDLLRDAGVDLETEEPVLSLIKKFAELTKKLEIGLSS